MSDGLMISAHSPPWLRHVIHARRRAHARLRLQRRQRGLHGRQRALQGLAHRRGPPPGVAALGGGGLQRGAQVAAHALQLLQQRGRIGPCAGTLLHPTQNLL